MFELALSSVLFSLSFGLIKAEVSGLDPFLVAFLRLLLSLLAFAPFFGKTRARAALSWAAVGFVQFGVMYCLYIASYRHLGGHQVALLTISTPIWVVLAEGALAGRIAGSAIGAAALAIAGGFVVTGDRGGIGESLAGIALVQGANVCFAVGQVWYRQKAQRSGLSSDAQRFAWMYLGSVAAPLLAMAFLERTSGAGPSTLRQWLSIAYLGLVPSALGFYLWNRGATQVGAGTLAVMNNVKVPLGVLLAWLLFGEAMVLWRVAAGLALTGAGLVLARARHPV